jgi:Ohr subfamily peroxiredoxin
VKILYTTEAVATDGGRQGGHVTGDQGVIDFDMVPPREFGGEGNGTNPEALFAAGYAACFASSLLTVGRRKKQDVEAASVTAKVGLGANENRGFDLDVDLHVTIPNVDSDTAQELVEIAHKVCPFSNAIRGNVDVRFVIE